MHKTPGWLEVYKRMTFSEMLRSVGSRCGSMQRLKLTLYIFEVSSKLAPLLVPQTSGSSI